MGEWADGLPVDDVLRVAVADGVQDLFHDVGCVLFAEELFLADFVEEFAARAESGVRGRGVLSDDEEVALVLVELVEPQDIGVVHLAEDLDLVHELLALVLLDETLEDDLHGPLRLGDAVLALAHFPVGPWLSRGYPTLAQTRAYPVVVLDLPVLLQNEVLTRYLHLFNYAH